MYFVGISPAHIIFLSYPRQGQRVPVLSPAALSKQYLPPPDRIGRHVPANRGAAGTQMAYCQHKRRVADSNLSGSKITKKPQNVPCQASKKAHLAKFSLKDFNIPLHFLRHFRNCHRCLPHTTRRILPGTCRTPKKICRTFRRKHGRIFRFRGRIFRFHGRIFGNLGQMPWGHGTPSGNTRANHQETWPVCPLRRRLAARGSTLSAQTSGSPTP